MTAGSIHADDNEIYGLLDAGSRGVTDAGQAKSFLLPTYEESIKKDVFELDYALTAGSNVRVWLKEFPKMDHASVQTVRPGVRVPNGNQLAELAVDLELMGSRSVQNIPIELKRGWNFMEEQIQWETLGDLEAAHFVIHLKDQVSQSEGVLFFALDFLNVPPVVEDVQEPTEVLQKQTDGSASNAVENAKFEAPALEEIEEKHEFTLLDGHDRGLLKTELASGTLLPTYDEAVGKDLLEFGYSVGKTAELKIWSRDFPKGLNEQNIDTIRLGIRVPSSEQVQDINLKLEIQGSAGIQSAPLKLKRGWNSIQKQIDWNQVGQLREVAFVIASKDSTSDIGGTLFIAADFVKGTPVKKSAVVRETFASTFGLMDAGAKGVFNIGPAKGNIVPVFDEIVAKNVWDFEYSVPKRSIIGVWTKEFPAELNKQAADAVRIGVKVPSPEQVNEVAVKVEIKGTSGMQTIPLSLKTGWNYFGEPISWGAIGDLTEVVFVVSPMAVGPLEVSPIGVSPMEITDEISGSLYFDVDFGQLNFLQKNFNWIKMALVLLLAVLLGTLVSFLGKRFGWYRNDAGLLIKSNQALQNKPLLAGIGLDFFFGFMAVFVWAVSLVIYSFGKLGPLDVHYGFLAVALLGASIAELFKWKLTGRHLTPLEIFQNIVVTGFFAASSSRLELLQAPGSWSQVLLLNNLIAALAFLIYHVSNAFSLGISKRHLGAVAAGVMCGLPYLFGWILLTENSNLIQALGNTFSLGFLGAWPVISELLGRLAVVFAFNEAVINGISFATQGRALKTASSHRVTFLISLGVVLSPAIADLGSTVWVGNLPVIPQAVIAVLATMLSYAGLWGEVYLITGVFLDGIRRTAPTDETIAKNIMTGSKKGFYYSGILLTLLYLLHGVLGVQLVRSIMSAFPLIVGTLAGAALFPLLKTIIETFDGSLPFFERTRFSYRSGTLYARGAVFGFGFTYMITGNLFQWDMSHRILFGLGIGLLASGGISVLRDAVYAMRGQGKIQTWRLYLVDSLLGGFVGSALAFYLDSAQVPVVIEKFKLYTSAGFSPVDYITYPLVNKWGRIDLGTYTGGAKLLYTESLAGVINWSIAAWLFAINKVFLDAYFQKDTAPIKFFFSRAGFVELINHMLYVLRWGLWMSPIIFTFLRMMPTPSWYNQDGAIRTLFAIFHNVTMSPEAFQAWSLKIFVYVLAFDFFRVLIWMDHMGLRVATLVNLSFIGMDKLDEKAAKFIGPAAAQRYIPEGVKRFTTWGPLLIPFYLPRGEAWDYAWSTSQAIQNAKGGGLIETLQALSVSGLLLFVMGAVLFATAVSLIVRMIFTATAKRREKVMSLGNRRYVTVVKGNGENYSEVYNKGIDVTRRSYDLIEPCGRVLFLVDEAQSRESTERLWPVIGNYPSDTFVPSKIEKIDHSLRVSNHNNGIETTIEISLPDQDVSAEIWTITVENTTDRKRQLKLVPYLEWVLNRPLDDRFHTQYARLFPEMEFVSEANAVLAWQKTTKSMGILASDVRPNGFSANRMDFIGRAQSIWSPRLLETFDFLPARDTDPSPTFDPIGSFLFDLPIEAGQTKTVKLLIGYASSRKSALEMVQTWLKPKAARVPKTTQKRTPLIGHGEILPGTPQPYSEFVANGNKLIVHTPFTPRPYDHAMSNAIHSVMVTNRGLHTSCNGNSQQNRLTPDWPDTVTKEVPSEAIYLYDIDGDEWFSPTYHPLNDKNAKHICEFGIDGTSLFQMTKGNISTELTVFVPPQDPNGVYVLTVKNNSERSKNFRVASFFEMVLSFQPERAGALTVRRDDSKGALYFNNPRNMFRTGWAFASMSAQTELMETRRGRFFGQGRAIQRPYLVEKGKADASQMTDDRTVAALLGTLQVPARGEATVAIVLGQTEDLKDAQRLVEKYKDLQNVRKSLAETRKWWLNLMGTAEIKSNRPEFDRLHNWLKYQAIAERIWARRGFYQTSGAFGFRDQLQDTVNLMWVDPSLARKQILLHASHQFFEGDVFHWFFTLTDGRTAFSCRSQASDNPLWLSWAAAEYVKATGDESILNERASYVVSEFPYAPLPKNKQGWGHLYHRSTRADSLYKHCMKSIDLVIDVRSGKHGLPLIQTGDWNDGLDEIGSEGIGESVWLGFFLYYILKEFMPVIEKRESVKRRDHYVQKMQELKAALEQTWRGDRYLRAYHDDGTEIGVKDSGVWEIDALTAAWAVMTGINPHRGITVFNTALRVLERDNVILLGWPALREDTKPYLGRSSKYPEGVRENGMYCHGVQWLVRAGRIITERFESLGDETKAAEYRQITYRLWRKIAPIAHVTPSEIEIYGGQPNKQAADVLTNFDPGRMIWHGYTGAAGWMLRQAFEGVAGASLIQNKLVLPEDLDKTRGDLKIQEVRKEFASPCFLESDEHIDESLLRKSNQEPEPQMSGR